MNTRAELGSAALEAVVGVPAFALLVGLIIFGGRTAMTHGAVESATFDAARSASIARSSQDARRQATEAGRASLANQGIACLDIAVTIDTAGFNLPVGRPASVKATIACRVDLSDLAVPGVPGSRWISATVSSPLDTFRERR